MCVGVLPAYMSVHHMHELEAVMSCHIGNGNQTLNFPKGSQCSQPLSHLSGPAVFPSATFSIHTTTWNNMHIVCAYTCVYFFHNLGLCIYVYSCKISILINCFLPLKRELLVCYFSEYDLFFSLECVYVCLYTSSPGHAWRSKNNLCQTKLRLAGLAASIFLPWAIPLPFLWVLSMPSKSLNFGAGGKDPWFGTWNPLPVTLASGYIFVSGLHRACTCTHTYSTQVHTYLKMEQICFENFKRVTSALLQFNR